MIPAGDVIYTRQSDGSFERYDGPVGDDATYTQVGQRPLWIRAAGLTSPHLQQQLLDFLASQRDRA